ncbi:MAG: penicillin-binding protein 2 [Planctomycetes bacterium]|nr:penicillin-binding protein 2 [Planctomycetota bacterium]
MDKSNPSTFDARHRQIKAARVVFVVALLLFVGLAVRLVVINTVMSERLLDIAASQQHSKMVIDARRGTILDVRGRLFAGSRPLYSVFADPARIEQPDQVARQLAAVLDVDAGELENAIRSSSAPRFCWLKRLIDDAQADAIRSMGIYGVGMRSEFERYWPMGETASHVLGFSGADGHGLGGLERKFDAHLSGKEGYRTTLRDARRRAIGGAASSIVPPQDGGHLVMTIDSVVQHMVEKRLAEQVEQYDAESGVAIVMAPRTGDVLAMACVPTFDPNRYKDFSSARRRNRAVTDPVEPGSVFKPFIASVALDRGFVDPHEMIDCHNGLYRFGGRLMNDTSPHGEMTLKDIVVFSSNIGMGIIGTRMGDEALYEAVTRFGFGEKTQIGVAGESAGLVPGTKNWSSYSKTSIPMGHYLAVTPIQLVTAFSSIFNGGYLLRPRLVRSRLNADFSPDASFLKPDVIRRVIPEEIAHYMATEVLPAVVGRHPANLDVAGYPAAGKTGTAQVPDLVNGGYEHGAYLSSFIAAAPYDDPQIVVLVMILKPDKALGYYGSKVAGPAVRDITRSVLQYLEVPPVTAHASAQP